MYLDRLAYTKDVLFCFDGRCRIVAAAVLIMAAVSATGIPALVIGIALCCMLLFRDLRVTVLRLFPVNLMMAAVWLSVPFGLEPASALRYTLRVNAAALLAMVFVIPMGVGRIASAMATLKVPPKLVSLFVLTYRSLFLMSGRLSTALVSMKLRLPPCGTLHRWRSFAAVFAATMASAVFRSHRVSLAMAARGFDGVFPRTHKFTWRFRDTALLLLCAAVAAFQAVWG
jgi:energy-coupling factor transporter transmembrane protein EcfT